MTLGLILVALSSWFLCYALGTFQVLTPKKWRGDRNLKSKWETHPCQLPAIENKEAMTAKGKVWRCHCGRRWRFERLDDNMNRMEWRTRLWKELTPEVELAEAQAALQALEGKRTPDAITGPARKRDDSRTGREPLSEMVRRQNER